MKLVITIIGLGNIGKTIATLLLSRQDSLHLNIMEVDDQVRGAYLDLQHAVELLGHSMTFNNQEAFNDSDFIFHCAGASVPKGESRMVTCKESVSMTETIFQRYQAKKTAFIIVVANPVDIITGATQIVTGLPQERVVGTGTFLDSVRMNFLIKKAHPDAKSVDAILLGEHGDTAFLSQPLSTINEQPLSRFLTEEQINYFMQDVKNAASIIKETQEATIYGVSHCAIQLFDALQSDEPIRIPVSTYVPHYLESILGEQNMYLSLYSEVSKKGVFPVKEYHPSLEEIVNFKKSIALMMGC